MNSFIVFAFVLLAVALASAEEEKYSTKFDDMDVETMLKNKKIKENYVNCILGKGKCTEAGELVKSKIFLILILLFLLHYLFLIHFWTTPNNIIIIVHYLNLHSSICGVKSESPLWFIHRFGKVFER